MKWSNVYSNEFWCKFRLGSDFFMDLWLEFCPKIDLPNLCRLFQKLFIRVRKKAFWASWCPMDCLGKQSRAFHVMLGRRKVVCPRYFLVVEHFFFNSFVLCDNLLQVQSPINMHQVCVCYYTSTSLECPCDLGNAPNFFNGVSSENLSRKYRFLGRFLFPGSLFLKHSCQLSEPGFFGTALAKQRLTYVDFRDDKKYFFHLS